MLGCPELNEAPRPELVEALHRPLLGDLPAPTDRDVVWEQLSRSLHGQALTERYVERWTLSRRLRSEGARVEVLRVDYDEVQVQGRGPGAARAQVAWSVGARLSHRQHQHLSVQRHRAQLDLRYTPQGWRITAQRVRDVHDAERPIDPFDLLQPEGRGGYLDPLDLLDAAPPENP